MKSKERAKPREMPTTSTKNSSVLMQGLGVGGLKHNYSKVLCYPIIGSIATPQHERHNMPQHQSILLQELKNFLQEEEPGARSQVWDNHIIL